MSQHINWETPPTQLDTPAWQIVYAIRPDGSQILDDNRPSGDNNTNDGRNEYANTERGDRNTDRVQQDENFTHVSLGRIGKDCRHN